MKLCLFLAWEVFWLLLGLLLVVGGGCCVGDRLWVWISEYWIGFLSGGVGRCSGRGGDGEAEAALSLLGCGSRG